MKILITLALLLSVAMSLGEPPEKSVIPLTITRNKSQVTVKIGELTIPNILLDTGFGFEGLMIYNPDYRDSLDLSRAKEAKISGAGSGAASNMMILDSMDFNLGDIEIKNQPVIVLKGDDYRGFPSNGLIGYSIFGHYITEFNYDENLMILHHGDILIPDDSWTEIPLYFKNNRIPWLDAAVVIEKGDPITLSMYIDYAAGDPVLLLERPEMKFSLPSRTTEMYLGRGLSGDIYGKSGYILKLIIGGHEINSIKASFAPAEIRSKQKDADAILGIGSLNRFNLIFDYFHKKLYIKPNSHFSEPFN